MLEEINKLDNTDINVEVVKQKKVRRIRCKKCKLLFNKNQIKTHDCIKLGSIEPDKEEEAVDNDEEIDEDNEDKKTKVNEHGGKHLFDLQLTLYMTLETSLKSVGNDNLNGLTVRMEEMRDSYKHIYDSLYEEYGDQIGEYVGPLTLWAVCTSKDIGTCYIENKKKAS